MRLTEKIGFGYILHIKVVDNSIGNEISIMGDTANKLGQLEDVMDKYKISDINELDLILNAYFLAVSKITPELMQNIKELEDIEEELGIDLITLFKAIHNGVWAKNSKQGIHFISMIEWVCEVSKVHSKDGTTYLKPLYQFNVWDGNNEDGDNFIYYFKDYGKTWALTKEELE